MHRCTERSPPAGQRPFALCSASSFRSELSPTGPTERTQADPRGVLRFRGGEAAALARLRYYLWESDCVATYFDTRDGMLGPDFSTKLSPWLALGCLSPRTVAAEVARYEAERVKNKSTGWCAELLRGSSRGARTPKWFSTAACAARVAHN